MQRPAGCMHICIGNYAVHRVLKLHLPTVCVKPMVTQSMHSVELLCICVELFATMCLCMLLQISTSFGKTCSLCRCSLMLKLVSINQPLSCLYQQRKTDC